MPGQLVDWRKWLLDLLCRMYQEWGLDCGSLGPPTQAIQELWNTYLSEGPPAFADPADKEEFLRVLIALEAHLNLKENDLDAKDDESLRELIARLRKDLES